ncbi:DUF6797 domain-containing protein [Roseiconus nitratireducens]|nr:DUF6797 domain-containing protein [Roseiconus nitratireducens]
MPNSPRCVRSVFLAASLLLLTGTFRAGTLLATDDVLRRENLVAWCIVPFDAAKRTPQARAQMLSDLGIRRCAYDWRAEHVPTFEQEILAYQKHGIEFFAFWGTHDKAFELFKKYDLHPQIWQTCPSPGKANDPDNVAAAAEQLKPVARRAGEVGCKLGLYNHGGWGGEPKNLVAVCERLRADGFDHVGIVYNFHHGHDHIQDWEASFERMKPYLLCLNLNGMNPGAQPKILGIGKGSEELEMIRVVLESDYRGPIGILDHRDELDARDSLLENRDGLRWVRKELSEKGSGGPKPDTPQPLPKADRPSPSDGANQGADPGRLLPGRVAYRKPPLTAQCRATLARKDEYNILIACDSKRSGEHWELFTERGNGNLTVYLPGYSPDHVRSRAMVCDGQPHTLAMQLLPDRVRLYVDGETVADQTVERNGNRPAVPGGLGLGRLVEGTLRHQGLLLWVHLAAGEQSPVASTEAPPRDDATLGFWDLADDQRSAADEPAKNRNPTPAEDGASATLDAPPAFDADRVRGLSEEARREGDAMRGAAVFADARLGCLSCHRVGPHGGTVGPELSQVAKQRTPEQIVESVLWPGREVKPEYTSWQVLLDDGRVLTGYKEPLDSERVRIRDHSSGRVVELEQDQIEAEVQSGTVMPTGLMQSITHQQQLDLFCFLNDLGRDGQPLPESIVAALEQGQHHHPATFPILAEPIRPELWPSSRHRVNRDRLYDFYARQAEHFLGQSPMPMLIAAYPGLDGGELGHWGNQGEDQWQDGRWNETELGSMQAGVFRGNGVTVPRAVCVQLGEAGQLSICFNVDRLTIDAVWTGDFLEFSSVRYGFLGGLSAAGTMIPSKTGSPPPGEQRYQGIYRSGKRVVFAYQIDGVDYLDSPWVERDPSSESGYKLVREIAPVSEHSLRSIVKGSPSQWPQVLATRIVPGQNRPYAIDTIELPERNPWSTLLFCSGHDFLSDGSAMVCTMQGDVWHVTGLDSGVEQIGEARWRRYASGLHHPQGLVVVDDKVFVQCRDQLVCLSDRNDDGEADFYECFSKAMETSAAGHDFICGLQRDSQGRFYTASGNQGLVRISADGQHAEVIATGFRNPDGLGLMPDGTVTVPCSEGTWTPASMICAVPETGSDLTSRSGRDAGSSRPLRHYGYRGPVDHQTPSLPLAYLPRGLDNSSGGQVWADDPRWGPLANNLVHLSFGMGTVFSVLQDRVDGQLQGAVVPLAGEFSSGAHRGRFRPRDGQLYVSGMKGWGTYTPDDGCFQRMRYTGQRCQTPIGFHVHQNGIRIDFAEPLDADVASDVANHFAQCWNYRYSGAYGSPELSTTHPGVAGHDPLRLASAHVLGGGKSLFLEIPEIQPVNQLHLHLRVNEPGSIATTQRTVDGHDLIITVHRMDAPMTEFPGYTSREKTIAAHPIEVDMATNALQIDNPWLAEIKGARPIEIATGKNLTYATQMFRAKSGEAIALTLSNPDVVPHNWVLAAPESLRSVGELANQLIARPDAFARHYVPETDRVIVHTDIVGPGKEQTIYFRAPNRPGRYPYLCTFPGHWMVMNGVMVVE